jgi:hypothetical protein
MKFAKTSITAALCIAANHVALTTAVTSTPPNAGGCEENNLYPCTTEDGSNGHRMCVTLNEKMGKQNKCIPYDDVENFLTNENKDASCGCCAFPGLEFGKCPDGCGGSQACNGEDFTGNLMCHVFGNKDDPKKKDACVRLDDQVDRLLSGWASTCGGCEPSGGVRRG